MTALSNPSLPQRLPGRFAELTLFVVTTAILLTAPMPMGPAGSLLAIASAWLFCLGGYLYIFRLANSSTPELHVIFTRYLMVVTMTVFAVVRINRAILFGAARSRVTWPSALCTIAIVLLAAIALPRLRSFRESAALARLEHHRFLAAAETTLDDFYIFDGVYDGDGNIQDFRFAYINPNAERRLQVPREELVGRILTEFRPFMITSGLIHKYREVVRTGAPFITEVYIDDERIKSTWLNVQVVKLGDGIAITSRDVTESRNSTDRIQYLAHYDPLTGLANRTLLYDRLRQAILLGQRHHNKVAVLMLDIDYFKRFNDTLGHDRGDQILATVGQRLLASVRESDTVARLGGDEFIVVMPEFQSIDDVRRCAENILNNASRPIDLAAQSLHLTLSIGISLYPDHGQDIPDLLRRADRAMYAIKESGRNGIRIAPDPAAQQTLGLKADPVPQKPAQSRLDA